MDIRITPNEEAVVRALHVLQDVCNEHSLCIECELSKNGSCVLEYQHPSEWRITPRKVVKMFE